MSIGSEMIDDSIAENAYYEYRAELMLAKRAWLTKDGREILVFDMSDSHLMNSINMMMRGGSGCFYGMEDDVLEMLTDEAQRRGLAVKR